MWKNFTPLFPVTFLPNPCNHTGLDLRLELLSAVYFSAHPKDKPQYHPKSKSTNLSIWYISSSINYYVIFSRDEGTYILQALFLAIS